MLCSDFCLETTLHEQVSEKDGQLERLREQNSLLIQHRFGRKSEQSNAPDSPQLAMFNEAESLTEPASDAIAAEVEKNVVAPTKRRGKRKPLPAELPCADVIHELPEHEQTCTCGCRKQIIGEETSEQLKIFPMQIRVTLHTLSHHIVTSPIEQRRYCSARSAGDLLF